MNVYVIDKSSMAPVPNSNDWDNHKHAIRLVYLSTDADVFYWFALDRPEAIITCGPHTNYPVLAKLPVQYRGRWVHVAQKSDITVHLIRSCAQGLIFKDDFRQPCLSIFTTAFASGNRIERAYRSILAQTTENWEWVIIDDSHTKETWKQYLKPLAKQDPRVRIYRRHTNDGFIGAMKRDAAMLCRGKYLVELDHDDEFSTKHALQWIASAFDQNPHINFIGSDCTEIYENTLANHSYGEYFGRGFQGYYAQWKNGRWINVARNGPLNGYQLRHIVGIYNHVRAMRASVYRELGGHNSNLRVADDYELFVRFFLRADPSNPQQRTMARLPENLYIQYRTYNQSNFTLKLNGEIQVLTKGAALFYENAIHARFEQLGIDDSFYLLEDKKNRVTEIPENPFWRRWNAEETVDCVLDPNPNCISIIMSTFNRPELCLRAVRSVVAQTFTNWMLYIVGDQCPALDALMDHEPIMHSEKIRYWNLITGGKDGAVPKNYAAKLLATSNYIAYLDDDNYWKPNHLETLYATLTSDPELGFVYSSFETEGLTVLCGEPVRKYRVDTSAVLHVASLFSKFGYWRTQKDVGYANDWEIVHRWKRGGIKHAATRLATLCYNNNHQHQNIRGIYEAYGDQIPLTDQDWINHAQRVAAIAQENVSWKQLHETKQCLTQPTNKPKDEVLYKEEEARFRKVIDETPEVSVYVFPNLVSSCTQ